MPTGGGSRVIVPSGASNQVACEGRQNTYACPYREYFCGVTCPIGRPSWVSCASALPRDLCHVDLPSCSTQPCSGRRGCIPPPISSFGSADLSKDRQVYGLRSR